MTLSLEQRSSLASAVARFEAVLAVDVEAQAYLAGRGFSPASANTHHLGVVPADMPGYEPYAGRLAIPYLTPAGIVDVRFRALHGEEPKYLGREGSGRHMYNVPDLQVDTDIIAVCEGEIDTMTASTMCGVPCVGLPGANGWKSLWARAFQDYSKVVVLCDGDDAGRDFGRRIKRDVDAAVSVHLPDGEDVNSMYVKYGADVIRERVYA